MRHASIVASRFAAVLLIAVQLSCGGSDSSAPLTATSITANSTTAISGAPGTVVTDIPSVIVRDQNGSAMRGVSVTFAVTSGGGSITGAAAVTDATGTAMVGSWTLGTLGLNTLTATATGLPPVTFTATVTDPCATAVAHVIGSTTNGELSASDCRIGAFVDQYTTSVATAGAYVFSHASNVIDALLVLFSSTRALGERGTNNGLIAGIDDDSPTSTNATIKAFLTAGNYTLAATSYDLETGPYTLSSASAPSAITNCEVVFAMPAISMTQTLQSTDCVASGFYSDRMYIFLRAGQAVTISMSSTAFDARLDLVGGSPAAVVATHEDPASGNARIVYTPTADGYFVIVPTSTAAGAIGAYALTIQ